MCPQSLKKKPQGPLESADYILRSINLKEGAVLTSDSFTLETLEN